MVSDQTIKAGGFKQRRKVKTFSREKTDGGRFGISKAMNCPAKSSTAFAAAGDIKKLKRKRRSLRRRCLQANRHRRPAHDIALLSTATNGCACEKAKYGNPPTSSMIRFWKSISSRSWVDAFRWELLQELWMTLAMSCCLRTSLPSKPHMTF